MPNIHIIGMDKSSSFDVNKPMTTASPARLHRSEPQPIQGPGGFQQQQHTLQAWSRVERFDVTLHTNNIHRTNFEQINRTRLLTPNLKKRLQARMLGKSKRNATQRKGAPRRRPRRRCARRHLWRSGPLLFLPVPLQLKLGFRDQRGFRFRPRPAAAVAAIGSFADSSESSRCQHALGWVTRAKAPLTAVSASSQACWCSGERPRTYHALVWSNWSVLSESVFPNSNPTCFFALTWSRLSTGHAAPSRPVIKT